MPHKYLIVASKKDPAGVNITTQLSQFQKEMGEIKFYLVDEDILHEENFDMQRFEDFDMVIFASMHKSVKREKTLCLHSPGNWRDADYGGKKGQVSKASALFNKFLFEKLNEAVRESSLREYKVCLEATHHGPLIDVPCVFIEIGSTELQWKDSKAGFVVAKAIKEAMEKFENSNEAKYREIAVGIGGPHYCPNFTKIQLNSNYALGHVIPMYSLPLSEEMVIEAINGTAEDVDTILLDWKGLGNASQREQVLGILDKLKLQYKKTSEVEK